MTQAQAATVAAALINAGYVPTVGVSGQVWRIRASSPAGTPINAQTVATFAANNGVGGQVYDAEFV